MPISIRILRSRLLAFSLLATLLLSGCGGQPGAAGADFDAAYQKAVKPYTFNYGAWEASTLASMLRHKLTGAPSESTDETQTVIDYFGAIAQMESLNSQMGQARAMAQKDSISSTEQQQLALRGSLEKDKPLIEKILSRQISLTLAEAGIYNPGANGWLKITFPPVSFELEPSLSILVVSPRDKIERMKEDVVRQDINMAQSDQLEAELESHDVSALVISLGGLGATYPSFVVESSDLRFILAVIAEEWLHQYMAFRPMGFRYVLELTGIINDPDISAINETAVGIASQEIRDLVYQRYYAKYFPAPDETNHDTDSENEPPQFDFNAAMRGIRLTVDAYLAAGQVEQAESYMEEQRQMLIGHGYYIRKLNQAYFAFNGSYAHEGTSVDPIGDQVRQLRSNSSSLLEFIRTASGLTSRQQLQKELLNNEK